MKNWKIKVISSYNFDMLAINLDNLKLKEISIWI